MTEEKKSQIIRKLRKSLFDKFNLNTIDNDALEEVIKQLISDEVKDEYITIEEHIEFSDRLFGAIRGLGILDSIIKDESITEIMINGPKDIFVEKDGALTKLEQTFDDERQLEDIIQNTRIQKIVGQAGREVTQASPIVDTRLPDGSRVNVVLPPISLNGATVTIRKFSKTPMTVRQLLKYGSITREVAHVLELLVKAKYNIFISGGTGSGKTTFLNAVSHFIPHDERVITIEDSAELQIEGVDNLVRMETRNANASGSGEITIRDLIKSSLRMRPERIVVGEVRGGEALDMLQAMNTGHDGSLSTGHANSTTDMLSRLETMVLQGSEGLPLEAIRQQIASAVDIIIHLSRLRDKTRKTMEISEITGYEGGRIQVNPIYRFVEDEHSTLEKVSGKLVRTENPFQNDYKLRLSGINEVI